MRGAAGLLIGIGLLGWAWWLFGRTTPDAGHVGVALTETPAPASAPAAATRRAVDPPATESTTSRVDASPDDRAETVPKRVVLVRVRAQDGSDPRSWPGDVLAQHGVLALAAVPRSPLGPDARAGVVRFDPDVDTSAPRGDEFARLTVPDEARHVVLYRGLRVVASAPIGSEDEVMLYTFAPVVCGFKLRVEGDVSRADKALLVLSEQAGTEAIRRGVSFGEALESPSIPPGFYSLRVGAHGHQPLDVPFVIRDGIEDLGALELTRAPMVHGRVVVERGELAEIRVRCWPTDGGHEQAFGSGKLGLTGLTRPAGWVRAERGAEWLTVGSVDLHDDGRFTIAAPPGEYEVRASGRLRVGGSSYDFASDTVSFDMERREELVLRLRRGVLTRIDLGRNSSPDTTFEIHTEAGEFVLGGSVSGSVHRVLAEGSYLVTWRDPYDEGERTFEIRDGGKPVILVGSGRW